MLVLAHASATEVWVATNGSDTPSCQISGGDPCGSIQYALRAPKIAVVRVAAGKYEQGVINFEGRAVMIQGEPGSVVDCNGARHAFIADTDEPSTAVPARRLAAD